MMRMAKLVRWAVVLLVLGTLASAAAKLTWHLRGDSGEIAHSLPGSEPAPAPVKPVDTSSIVTLAPFGSAAPVEPEAPETESEEAPLDLELRGVVVDPRADRSVAYVQSAGTTKGYRPGDDIAGLAVLVSVAPDRITIRVDGAERVLSFRKGEELIAEEDAQEDEPSALGRLRAALITGEPGKTKARPEPELDPIEMWRERINRNPGEVLDRIGLVPEDNGYRVSEKHDSGVDKAGLRTGDLVTRVNGQAVGDVEADRKLYDKVAASGQARVEIQRDGKTIVLSFPLR